MDAMLSAVSVVILACVLLVLFITFVTVPIVRDAKIDINRKMCEKKIEYAQKKAEFQAEAEIKVLQAKMKMDKERRETH
jgi:hypothetical protein